MNLARQFHTVRHLRPIQVCGRVWFHAYHPRPDLRPAPPARARSGHWSPWSWRPSLMLDATTFNLLNVTGSVRTAADWQGAPNGRLWTYNLHYFDDLNAQDAASRRAWHRALIARWVRENPPGAGAAWEPYPTSLRIVNWIKSELAAARGGESLIGGEARDSLATQVRWLRRRLERHLLANHLFANAKALAFAGAFFDSAEADGWLAHGAALLERELGEQVLPDGGHFERSPMYHAMLLEDVLDLLNLTQVFPSAVAAPLVRRWAGVATRMLRWLQVMTHPDGRPSFFNDAAFGVAAEYAALTEYAMQLGVALDDRPLAPVEMLEASGYARLANGRATVICDVAPVGPDYLPAHAHADTLSFELSLDGERWLVNGGTSTYDPGPERERQRGSAAHNTVVVDDQDSSEVWGAFRVARRARPFGVASGCESDCLWLEASHDGYRRLKGRVTHRRKWILERDSLAILDSLEGRFRSACAVLRLHPDVTARAEDGSSSIGLSRPAGGTGARVRCEPPVPIVITGATWHPEFGRAVPAAMLALPFSGASLVTRITW